jgi:3-isopropylmalate/(R)-2-methylmalate dehydratase small subunit
MAERGGVIVEAFKTYRGVAAALNRANVDTDQIIAKQFLKSIKRTGFGENLFDDWAHLPDGSPNPEFELNRTEFKGASILVARNNFGCGSSREHAVWAVCQAGFKTVIAPWREVDGSRVPGFADIFANNAVKNGLLTIQLPETDVDAIFEAIEKQPGLDATVDLENRTVTLHTDEPNVFVFDIDPGVRDYLLRGLDEIALTLEHEADISAYEARNG